MKKEFKFWDYYSELSTSEKLFLSYNLYSGDSPAKTTQTLLESEDIDEALRRLIGTRQELKEMKKQTQKHPEKIMTMEYSKSEIEDKLSDVFTILQAGNTRNIDRFVDRFLKTATVLTLFEVDKLKSHISRREVHKYVLKPTISTTPKFEKALLQLHVLANTILEDEDPLLNEKFEEVVEVFVSRSKDDDLKKEFLSLFDKSSIEEYSDVVKTFIEKNKDHFKNAIIAHIKENYQSLSQDLIEYLILKREYVSLQNEVKKFSAQIKQLNKLQTLNDELKQANKELQLSILSKNQQISTLEERMKEKEKENPEYAIELISQLYSDIRQKDSEITKLNKKIIELIKNPEKNIYQTFMEKQEKDIVDLKIRIKEYKDENKSLSKSIENPVKFIKEYIEEFGISEELYEFMSPHISTMQALIEKRTAEEEMRMKEIEELQAQELLSNEEPIRNYIGYITFEEERLFLNAGDGIKFELLNIPEKTYLSNNQFAIARSNGTFLATFPYYFVEGYRDFMIHEFGIYQNGDNKTIKTGDNKYYDASNFKSNIWDKSIVAINKEQQIIKYFKQKIYTIDDFYEHASHKGHKFYFIEEVLPNFGVLVRDIETDDILELNNLKFKDMQIDEKTTITTDGDRVITAFYNTRFYTNSSFYKGQISGLITEEEGVLFLSGLNGESVKLLKYPQNLINAGDFCVIDEFGNFLKKESVASFEELSKKTAPLQRDKVSDVSPSQLPDITASVLIVGNIHYRKSYIETFRKKGYEATVISGFESLQIILNEAKDKDYVVLSVSHVSHDNMWRLKESNANIIYARSDGANRILEDIESSSMLNARAYNLSK